MTVVIVTSAKVVPCSSLLYRSWQIDATARRGELSNHVCGLDRFAQIQPSDVWPEALVHLAAYDR